MREESVVWAVIGKSRASAEAKATNCLGWTCGGRFAKGGDKWIFF